MILRIKFVLFALGLSLAACDGPAQTSPQVTPASEVTPQGVDSTPIESPEPTTGEPTPELEPQPEPQPQSQPTIDAEAAVAAVDENLARLAGLQVVGVGQLLIDAPEGAMNCYGACPGFEDEIAEATQDSAVRLAELVQIAEEIVATPADPAPQACEPSAVEANLEALAGLRIVHIDGLLEVEPANNPMCYNLPCQEDIEAAEAATCERAQLLDRIAAEAVEKL